MNFELFMLRVFTELGLWMIWILCLYTKPWTFLKMVSFFLLSFQMIHFPNNIDNCQEIFRYSKQYMYCTFANVVCMSKWYVLHLSAIENWKFPVMIKNFDDVVFLFFFFGLWTDHCCHAFLKTLKYQMNEWLNDTCILRL